MDGQDPRRGYGDDPSYTNQQPPFDARPNRRGSLRDSSGNRPQPRLNPTATSGRQDGSDLEQPYEYYPNPNPNQASAHSILSQGGFGDNYNAVVSPERPSNYGNYAYSAAGSYEAPQPMSLGHPTFGPPQYLQRPAAPPSMLENNDFDYLGSAQPDIQLQLPLPPAPASYAAGRAIPSLAAPPIVQLPQLQQAPAALPVQALVRRSPFDIGADQLYTDLQPIIQAINNNGDLNHAVDLLLRTSHTFLVSVEDMGLTVDNPEQEERGYQLWRDFNHTWLALIQAQYRRTFDLQRAGSAINHPGLMSRDVMYNAVTELRDLAREYVEDRGLLDYEWGLWESDITQAAHRCMDLMNGGDGEE